MRILLAAALLSAPVPALAQEGVPIAGTLLDVHAQGRTTRTPDLATIRAGVVAQAPTAAAALADQAERMARVLEALKRAGVADRDVATATVGLQPQYVYQEREPPRITGYQATNSVSVRFRDVRRAGAILDALVGSGANQIDGPDLSIDQPDAALDEARLDAMRRARARFGSSGSMRAPWTTAGRGRRSPMLAYRRPKPLPRRSRRGRRT
jgi:uncharacterized protein